MRSLIAMALGIVSVCISGCASTGGSNFTPSDRADAAIVKARWHRESAFVWEGYRFLSIDDKFVSTGFMSDPREAVLTVEPGARSFVIGVEFNRGLGTGPFQAIVPMKATLSPGLIYQLMDEISGNSVIVWLEGEKSKELSSERASAPWGKSPPSPTPIPVFIPSR